LNIYIIFYTVSFSLLFFSSFLTYDQAVSLASSAIAAKTLLRVSQMRVRALKKPLPRESIDFVNIRTGIVVYLLQPRDK
jgi:hypothetical protein